MRMTESELRELLGKTVRKSGARNVVDPLSDVGTELERRFDTLHKQIASDLPAFQKDFGFLPDRGFRIDRAWPDVLIAVELEGIDHRKENRYHRDIEKYNLLALHGWMLFRAATRTLNDPDAFFTLLRNAYAERTRRR